MFDNILLWNLIVAWLLSAIVWLILFRRQQKLNLASNGAIELYCFIIAMDLVMAYKSPKLQALFEDGALTDRGSMSFFLILAFISFGVAWTSFKWLSYAEIALSSDIIASDTTFLTKLRQLAAGGFPRLLEGFRRGATWAWWMAWISGVRWCLTTVHIFILLALPTTR
jgi:hypothetical protein